MKIHQHVAPELLADYAAGSLGEAWSLVVATHLSMCADCRWQAKGLETVAAALALDADESDLAVVPDSGSLDWSGFRERLGKEMPEIVVSGAALNPGRYPAPLECYVLEAGGERSWRPLGLGAYHLPLKTGDGVGTARLLRVPAGRPVPEHSHRGRELTLVLEGAFESLGTTYRVGDIEDADDAVLHQPVATPDRDCICLAVTEAPLRFRGWFMNAIQPVIGI